jgi:peptidoglycan/xylan/chitin deacetylase (PgdA/CDA1 family)
MKPDGFANRLVLGDDGRVWTEVITPEGKTTLTRDGDVMPILDDYVDDHPGFSWKGAKGTMALTGYQGALGYRITDGLPQEAEWKQIVMKIADTMKANGWSFACHSYTHNGYFRDGTLTMKQIKYDTDRWIEKIAPYVGKTNIYISPFGVNFKKDDPRYRYLIDKGYQIYCPVGNGRRIAVNGDNIVMPRVNLDGYSMNRRATELETHYFNVSEILDPKRPALVIN